MRRDAAAQQSAEYNKMVLLEPVVVFYNFKGKIYEFIIRIDSRIEEREQERTEDALASGGEEGRGKLR